MSDEADEAYSVTEQLTMTGINRIEPPRVSWRV
ncbi:hypothetical protein ACRG06_003732, partial [Shigella flexneri]